MNTEEYERMYRTEDSYWWFVGRHHLVETFMKAVFGSRNDLAILDIGCGTGAMSVRLTGWGRVVSADFSTLALSFCMRRSLSRLCAADATRLPFEDGSFDVVVALDLLEHVENDVAAMQEFCRVLKPGGRLISTVPAYPSLWSGHDVALMHQRRYVAREIWQLATNSGLKVTKISYAMTALYPIVWIVRRLFSRRKKQATPKADIVNVPGAANKMLTAVLKLENAFIRRISLPFGVTIFCMAERER